MRVSVLDQTKRCCPLGLDHETVNRCNCVDLSFMCILILPQHTQYVNGPFVQCRWSESLWQKTLLCSVTVVKRSFLLLYNFVWTNEPHTNKPVTSLGHQEWRRVWWEGPIFFKLCPTHFSREGLPFLVMVTPNFVWSVGCQIVSDLTFSTGASAKLKRGHMKRYAVALSVWLRGPRVHLIRPCLGV